MLPVLSSKSPSGSDWVYEVKYDGFRAILYIDESSISLVSRNGKDLLHAFPEIYEFVQQHRYKLNPFLPLTLDGELVSLCHPFASDFQKLQIRGRLKSAAKIKQASTNEPCRLLIFDILLLHGKPKHDEIYSSRKAELEDFFQKTGFPLSPSGEAEELIQMIPFYPNCDSLWDKVQLFGGEGIVAKNLRGKWLAGKRTESWKKVKNYRSATLFITGYDEENGYFETGLFRDGLIYSPGSFSHGLQGKDREALIQIVKKNASETSKAFIKIEPAICVRIHFLSFYKERLREPSFAGFDFQSAPEKCTWEHFQLDAAPLHSDVQVTHPDKPIWKSPAVTKLQYLLYLLKIAPYLLPLLKDRVLTLIRYPHGSGGEQFYQKNKPDYAPSFIQSAVHEGIDYMTCRHLSDLIWLGNQLALEFHVPFERISEKKPMEIVFDLDPPDRNAFHLAVSAAMQLEILFKEFGLVSFPKLSGGKGIQIHIPLSGNLLTYEDTRTFTSFIADYLTRKFPDAFTTERLKKHRAGRLYIDYLQHGEGKTIIAPYSPRGAEGACVAAPLLWEEVTDNLSPSDFTVFTVFDHLIKRGCPFENYLNSPQDETVSNVIAFIRKNLP
ncbi:DNA ligase D [Bacillus sp. FJAT-42376]|uniref:DNA ligase D n=1 Tax=Bacillus sp. FJAT-42376 TaxID=2014076 RepID=UPI001F150AC8|nr:DNA ligase D [Bacillus sp. FJAT-42376]